MTDAGIETELVTIRKYEAAAEAHLARGRLAVEGIDAAVTDEHLVDFSMFYGRTMGGICLLVRAEDANRARGIIATTVKPEGGAAADRCPACGSDATRHGLASQNRLAQILLFGLILVTGFLVILFLRWRWRCEACGHRWRDPPPKEDEGV